MRRLIPVIALALGGPASASAPLPDSGTWAMVVDVASRSEVPFAGTTEVVSRSLLHVRLEQGADGRVVQRQRVCDVKLLSDARAETVLPDAFIAAIPQQSYRVDIGELGGVLSYFADPGPTHVGYDPAVTGGAVPQRARDEGVLDMDGDGFPGGTVNLVIPVFGSVRIYVAQRGHSRYRGVLVDGVIIGDVEIVAFDQRTLGASFAPFAANPTITPVPEQSRFVLAPVEDGASCTALKGRWDGDFEVPTR